METIYMTELEHKGNLRIVVEVHTSTDGFSNLESRKPRMILRPVRKENENPRNLPERELPRNYNVRARYLRDEESYDVNFDIDSTKAFEWFRMVEKDEHPYRAAYYFTNMFLAAGLPVGLQLTKASIDQINYSLSSIIQHQKWISEGHVGTEYMHYMLPEDLL
tara:strand:- start:522 stop:1010 length:489 start_codon:yes stop_codon:yes gene_type:complete